VNKKVFQFKALPFGLIVAPRIFSAVMRELGSALRQRGIVIHMYLDDWLIRHKDKDTVERQTKEILDVCYQLGLIINVRKSQLEAVQNFDFVGVNYNLEMGQAFPPKKRLEKLTQKIQGILALESSIVTDWMSLIGLINSITDQVPLGRLRLRPLQWFLASNWKDRSSQLEKLQLSSEVQSHLRWWLLTTNTHVGVPLEKETPNVQMFTDASTTGWGAHINDVEVSGVWKSYERSLHINVLELRAVRYAVAHCKHLVRRKLILVATDNTTVIAYINHQGGMHSRSLMEETTKLFEEILALESQIQARHIPGKLNVWADRLSRRDQVAHTEWALHPDVFNSLWTVWEKPMVDLFATSLNHKLSLYVSPIPDDCAMGVDAMSMDWTNLYAYAFPPSALIPKVISKIKRTSCRVVLIAPKWPDRPWYPELLELTPEPPIQLPHRSDLLKQPHCPSFHQNVNQLDLHAWMLLNQQ